MDADIVKAEQARLQVEANSGIALPVAGAIYWCVLGVWAFFLILITGRLLPLLLPD